MTQSKLCKALASESEEYVNKTLMPQILDKLPKVAAEELKKMGSVQSTAGGLLRASLLLQVSRAVVAEEKEAREKAFLAAGQDPSSGGQGGEAGQRACRVPGQDPTGGDGARGEVLL